MLSAFARDEELPFLYYISKQRDPSDPHPDLPLLTLAAGPGTPSTITFDELWGEPIGIHQFEHTQPFDAVLQVQFNFLANIIAAETRRGVGNMAFVGNQEWVEILSTGPRPPEAIMYLPHLKHNELRVAYFNKLGMFKAVDGGVGLLPSGLQVNPNGHEKYFARSFL